MVIISEKYQLGVTLSSRNCYSDLHYSVPYSAQE